MFDRVRYGEVEGPPRAHAEASLPLKTSHKTDRVWNRVYLGNGELRRE